MTENGARLTMRGHGVEAHGTRSTQTVAPVQAIPARATPVQAPPTMVLEMIAPVAGADVSPVGAMACPVDPMERLQREFC